MGRRTGILESGRVLYLPLGSIRPNPAQPRRVFDPAGLQELADSIREYGILQPLTVRRRENGYELIAGERRLRAAGMAGLTQAPCLVAAVDEEASGMLALVENLQRRDLDFIEEAEGLARLMKTWGLSQEQAARKVGKSQSAVANKLRLLRLSPSVLAELRLHSLSERHARALLKLRSEDEQLRVVGQIVQGGWTVAKTEAYIESLLQPPRCRPKREFRRLRPAGRARVFQLGQPPARPHPLGGRRRAVAAAGNRARDRPHHSHPKAGSRASLTENFESQHLPHAFLLD